MTEIIRADRSHITELSHLFNSYRVFYEQPSDIEKAGKFIESRINNTTGKKIPFFNLGPQNDWRKLLDEKIRLKLETSFKKQMEELHYL